MPLDLGSLLVSSASFVMGCALLKEEIDHMYRIGCPNEPESLTHYNESPRLYNIYLSGDMLRYCHKEIISHMTSSPGCSCEAFNIGIVVMGFLDALVYAHHQHCRILENTGNFGDCMKRRIRFMTAITPAYAHAYQAPCLAQHMPAVPRQNFRLPKPKA